MSQGTNRHGAITMTSEQMLAKAKEYTERGLHELAKGAKSSAERLKKQGR